MGLSSLKCGHDAPVYSVLERIIKQSGTPYFCFKDLDENKPLASIKLRVETIDYFLKSYCDRMQFSTQAVRSKSYDDSPVTQSALVSFEPHTRTWSVSRDDCCHLSMVGVAPTTSRVPPLTISACSNNQLPCSSRR